MFYAHFRSSLVSKGQLQIIVVDSKRCREALGNYEVKLGNCGDISTGTKSIGTGTHMQLSYSGVLVLGPNKSGTGTQVLLENQWSFGTDTTLIGTGTNMRSLQNLRGISILVQGHACLLIPTSRSLMWIIFKPT